MEFNIIVPTILVVIGIVFLSWSGISFLQQNSFLKDAVSATGVINGYDYSATSRIQRESDSETGFAGHVTVTSAWPKIEFTAQTGELVSVIAKTSTETRSSEQVKVLYLPGDPQTAKIDEFFPLWGMIIIITCFGCLFCLVGVALRFLI